MTIYTDQQIQNWKRFEKVRQSGKFNMFSSDARAKAELFKDDHLFIIKNYDGLKKQALEAVTA
jgi:hypothetical protein